METIWLQEFISLIQSAGMNSSVNMFLRQLNRVKPSLEVSSMILSVINSTNPCAEAIKTILSELFSRGITFTLAKHGIPVYSTGVIGRLLVLAECIFEAYGFADLANAVGVANGVYRFSAIVYPLVVAIGIGGGPLSAVSLGVLAFVAQKYLLGRIGDWLAGSECDQKESNSAMMDIAQSLNLFLLLIADITPSPADGTPPNPRAPAEITETVHVSLAEITIHPVRIRKEIHQEARQSPEETSETTNRVHAHYASKEVKIHQRRADDVKLKIILGCGLILVGGIACIHVLPVYLSAYAVPSFATAAARATGVA